MFKTTNQKTIGTKKGLVKTLKDKIAESRSLIFTNYQGLTVSDVGALKRKLREVNCEYKVVKNNFFRIAAEESGVSGLDTKVWSYPLAVAFIPKTGDISSAAKVIYEFKKDKTKLVVKSSLVDSKVCTEKELEYISQLPPREVLIAKVLGAMKAPVSRLHGVLSGIMRKLVLALKQIEEKKKAEGQ